MPAIQSDAALLNEYDDAIESDDAFMDALFGDADEAKDAPRKKDEPSEDADEEVFDKKAKDEDENTNDDEANDDDESSEETPEEEDEEGDEGETKETEAKAKKYVEVDDDTYVKIKVDGEEREVKVADLNRLWGQEAALTRRSQEVAIFKTQYDEGMAKNLAAYNVLMSRASERANEYRNLPWTQLMKDPNVPADQLATLQADAQKALEEEAFLKNEIDGFMKTVETNAAQERQTAARDCIKSLTDTASPHHIKGWSEALYGDIRNFATGVGIPAQMVNSITDPAAIKVLHMAMQFQRGAKKVVTKTVNKQPTKIVKNSAAAPAARSGAKTVTSKQAAQKAIKTGSMNDAVDAFEALFD